MPAAIILNVEERQTIIDLYLGGLSFAQVAEATGHSNATVRRWLKQDGIKSRTISESKIKFAPIITQGQKANVLSLYESGLSPVKIAEKTPHSVGGIKKFLRESGVKIRGLSEAQREFIPIDDNYFTEIDTEEKVYFLGFLFADGNVKSEETNNRVVLKLAGKDREIIEKFSDIIFGYERIYDYCYKDQFGIDRDSSQLDFSSHQMKQDLIRHGCIPNKSLVLEFPKLNPLLHRHFMRGYFDGDGCLSELTPRSNGCIDYHFSIVSTERFCHEYADILVEAAEVVCKINGSLDWEERNNFTTKSLTVRGNRQVAKIMDWLYQDATIFLQRKHQIYLRMKEYLANIDAKLVAQYVARDAINQQIMELRQSGMAASSIAERLNINEGRVWRGIYAFDPPPSQC